VYLLILQAAKAKSGQEPGKHVIYVRLRRRHVTFSGPKRRFFVSPDISCLAYISFAMKTLAYSYSAIGRQISVTGPIKKVAGLPLKNLIAFSLRKIVPEYSIGKYILIYTSAFISIGLIVLSGLLMLNFS
jgi:hypothetical protein